MFLRVLSHPVWSSVVILASLAPAAIAHNIQVDGTIGATFHIEPNHNPRAGEPATAWFALTKAGGELLGFAQCDCRLQVYNRAANPDTPVLTPPLKAIAAEQYSDIPGAEIVFPQAGIYELEISGSPKSGTEFEPFALTYSVTVSPGKPVETPAPAVSSAPATPTPDRPSGGVARWTAIAASGLIGAIALWIVRHKASK